MAKNTTKGSRIGAIINRTQTYNPKTNQYIKRNTENGQFMSTKSTPYKSVRKKYNPQQIQHIQQIQLKNKLT